MSSPVLTRRLPYPGDEQATPAASPMPSPKGLPQPGQCLCRCLVRALSRPISLCVSPLLEGRARSLPLSVSPLLDGHYAASLYLHRSVGDNELRRQGSCVPHPPAPWPSFSFCVAFCVAPRLFHSKLPAAPPGAMPLGQTHPLIALAECDPIGSAGTTGGQCIWIASSVRRRCTPLLCRSLGTSNDLQQGRCRLGRWCIRQA